MECNFDRLPSARELEMFAGNMALRYLADLNMDLRPDPERRVSSEPPLSFSDSATVHHTAFASLCSLSLLVCSSLHACSFQLAPTFNPRRTRCKHASIPYLNKALHRDICIVALQRFLIYSICASATDTYRYHGIESSYRILVEPCLL